MTMEPPCYVAALDAIPSELFRSFAESGWTVTVAPAQVTVAKAADSRDQESLRNELMDVLGTAEPSPRILWEEPGLPSATGLTARNRLADLPEETRMRLLESGTTLVEGFRTPWQFTGSSSSEPARGSVGGTLAAELELLDRLDRLPTDPEKTASKSMTKALLQARIDSSQADAELVRKDVELKSELLKQQAKVTALLDEFLRHAAAWRGLAQTGKHVLIGLTLFSCAVTGFLAFLLYDEKLDPWAFTTAVFVLALFAISPAVLLIIERPLKGIDQWMPSGKAEDNQEKDQSASSAADKPKAAGETRDAKE